MAENPGAKPLRIGIAGLGTVGRGVIRLIETNQSFLITSHINPDCDALGSELALAEHLVNLGKEVMVINSVFRGALGHGMRRFEQRRWGRWWWH